MIRDEIGITPLPLNTAREGPRIKIVKDFIGVQNYTGGRGKMIIEFVNITYVLPCYLRVFNKVFKVLIAF